ncbi:MAG: 6-carboxytetrahydropterin synthase [Phycisphaerales bacterium]|nr:6-carboxytetrahydropterin synthase [Phycisphaerales bacterium]
MTRTIRMAISPQPHRIGGDEARRNTFASWPTPDGLAAWYEFDVSLVGEPDPRTGYLLGIDVIDAAARANALPILGEALSGQSREPTPSLLVRLADSIASELGPACDEVRWRLTPRHELRWTRPASSPLERTDSNMTTTPSTEIEIQIRERFEFAAAHRLHCPDQSDQWNRETFGKCNNPRGHGHNYEIEVAVACRIDETGEAALSIHMLESIVEEQVIKRFDHRHLNEDCPEFADRNPSVENITITCHDLLSGPISSAQGRLISVTVWETGKTSCTYPAN